MSVNSLAGVKGFSSQDLGSKHIYSMSDSSMLMLMPLNDIRFLFLNSSLLHNCNVKSAFSGM